MVKINLLKVVLVEKRRVSCGWLTNLGRLHVLSVNGDAYSPAGPLNVIKDCPTTKRRNKRFANSVKQSRLYLFKFE